MWPYIRDAVGLIEDGNRTYLFFCLLPQVNRSSPHISTGAKRSEGSQLDHHACKDLVVHSCLIDGREDIAGEARQAEADTIPHRVRSRPVHRILVEFLLQRLSERTTTVTLPS